MASAMKGLRLKPTYEQLIDVAVSDGLEHIRFPNRDASFLRNGFVLSQLDGEGMRQMEKQQEMASKESYKEHLLKEIAKNTGSNIHDLRNDNHDDMRKDRIEKAVHFDISQDDDDDVTMTDSSEVKAEQAKAQTTSSGSQPSTTKMDQFGGTQTTRIKMKEKGNQSKATAKMDQFGGTQTTRIKMKEKGSQSQATEDRTEEIEQLRQATELEKQALIQKHEQNIERVRQQVTAQVMAHAEAEHSKKQEGYKQEFIQRTQITEAEAQRQINKAQQQAQQEAQQYAGSVFQYAQEAHREQQRAKREQMNQIRKEKEKAELEQLRAENRAKRAERAEHNTEYKATPSTPDNRAKPKKQEQVLHELIIILNIILITKMSKHPIIDQRLNQKPDLHLKSLIKAYHHSLQVKKQVGVKITQNLHTNQKGKQEDQQIHKQRQKFKKICSKKNQNHKQNQPQEKNPNTTLK